MESNKMEFHRIWIEQCDATKEIHDLFGLQRALDYLIGEKLFSFVQAAEHEPRFLAELPHFIDEIRRIFTAEEISRYLDDLERTKFLAPPEPEEDKNSGDDLLHDPVWGAQEILRFARI